MRIIFLACILFLIQVSSQDVKAEERDEGLSEMKVFIISTKCAFNLGFNEQCILILLMDCRRFY